MDAITQEEQHLVEKLKMAREIYQKSASKVHTPIRNRMLELASQKDQFLNELGELLDFDTDEKNLGLKDRIKVEYAKLSMEINNILISLSEGGVLRFCIEREEELISMYHTVLKRKETHEQVLATSEDQLSESEQLVEELKEIKSSYDFPR